MKSSSHALRVDANKEAACHKNYPNLTSLESEGSTEVRITLSFSRSNDPEKGARPTALWRLCKKGWEPCG